MELNNAIYKKITNLCNDGNKFIEICNYNKAIKVFSRALKLIPSPKKEWEASTWIYTALGDAYFFSKDYSKAADNYYNALNCPDGITNPYILLKLGEALCELGKVEKAKEYLLKAYMLEGEVIFEDEDIKYSELIKELK